MGVEPSTNAIHEYTNALDKSLAPGSTPQIRVFVFSFVNGPLYTYCLHGLIRSMCY